MFHNLAITTIPYGQYPYIRKAILIGFWNNRWAYFDMNPEQRISLIMDITKIKDNMHRAEDNTQDESI